MTPAPAEVAELIEAPLDQLVDPAHRGQHIRGVVAGQVRRWQFSSPHVQLGENRIWGATAIILGELIALIRDLQRAA